MRQRPGARRASFDPASAELAAADGIHRLRVFQGGKISRLLSQIGRLDHPAEDFAVARFGQLRDEMNLLRPKRLPHVASQSEEHTSELQSRENLVCRLLL